MSNSDPVQAPPPKSSWWKWTKRIGCTLLLLIFTCCGLTCTGGWWLEHRLRNINANELDRFHADGLRGGDIQAMFERADPEFRKRHTLEEVRAFLDARPGLLDRDKLHGLSVTRRVINGVEYIKIKSQDGLFADAWEIVCKVVDDTLVLIGISPGLDELVPSSLKQGSGSSRRRHRHH